MRVIKSEIGKLSLGQPEEVDEILDNLKPIELKKGEFLLREGAICNRYYFIESGTVRLYFHKEESDFTVWMGTPGEIFTNLESYLNRTPSQINIEAIEPTLVYVISKEASDQLASTSNAYNTLLRRTVEIAFVNLAKNVMSFQSDEAHERYKRVENEKNWLAKYPLRYISSFIGVTQSSLSRIRAKKS